MSELLLLLTVVTLTFSAQADMMSLSNATYRHVKTNQVVKPSITQVEATALQANHQQRVITAMPEGELKIYKRTGGQGIFPNNDQLGLDLQSGKMDIVFTVDGIRNTSDIVYLEVYPTTGVDELNAGKQIAGVRYYNLAGQEMAQPSGMAIQVTTYTDGTRTATKGIK